MIEQDLISKIKSYLNTITNLFYWKEHGGNYGTSGIPDIIVCYKGKFIAFECKLPGKKPTLLQTISIRKINMAGGLATVVTDLNQVVEIINALKNN